jgi:multicomponent Na+:H+ antiporter subunit E
VSGLKPKQGKAKTLASGATPKAAFALFCLLLAMWLLASGHYTVMMISFGVASSAAVVALGLAMKVVDDEAVPIRLLGRAFGYVPWIAWEVFKANVDVARRILGPPSAISPRIIEAPTSQKSELGRVLYANSITLTPGTVSIRVHGKTITVHAIADEVADGLLEGAMDGKVTWFEGLS